MATSTNPPRPQDEMNRGKGQDTLRDKAGQMAEKGKDMASNVADRAKDVASNVADRAKDMASSLGHRAEDATHAVGSGMQSLAGTVREKLPNSGVVGAAASTLASGLESSGHYLNEQGLKGIAEDVTSMIRRNPVPAMLIGVAVGFLVARATARS